MQVVFSRETLLIKRHGYMTDYNDKTKSVETENRVEKKVERAQQIKSELNCEIISLIKEYTAGEAAGFKGTPQQFVRCMTIRDTLLPALKKARSTVDEWMNSVTDGEVELTPLVKSGKEIQKMIAYAEKGVSTYASLEGSANARDGWGAAEHRDKKINAMGLVEALSRLLVRVTVEGPDLELHDAALLKRVLSTMKVDGKFSQSFHDGVLSTETLLGKLQSFLAFDRSAEITDETRKKISEALDLMLILHIDQKDRPDGPPYLSHTMNVARRLIEEYGVRDPEMIIAALLHDSVEDQVEKLSKRYTGNETDPRLRALGYIEQRFGKRVSYIIQELSNPEEGGEALKEKKATMTEQEIARAKMGVYKDHVRSMITKVNPETGRPDAGIALIKLGDFSDNALSLHNISERSADGEIDAKKLNKKVKLCVKYAPVIDVFIDRIAQDDLAALLGNKLLSTVQQLQKGKAYIEEFLGTPEARVEKKKLLGE